MVSACAQPTGPSGVLPSSWLTPGVLTSAPSANSEPTAVPTTSGLRESISVWPSCVLTNATSATVDARRRRPVTLASAHAAVAAPAVVVPRTATVRHSAASSGPLPALAAGESGGLTASAAAGSASVSMLTSSNCRVFNGERPDSAVPRIAEAHFTRVAAEEDGHRGLHALPQLTPLVEGVQQRADLAVEQHDVRRSAGGIAALAATPMPTVAVRMAAASLAPSPTIAHTRPNRSSVSTICTLCSGDIRANTIRSRTDSSCPARDIASQSAPLTTCSADVEAEFGGDRHRGDGVVAGDEPDSDAVGDQPGEDGARFRPGSVGQSEQTDELQSLAAQRLERVGIPLRFAHLICRELPRPDRQHPKPVSRHTLHAVGGPETLYALSSTSGAPLMNNSSSLIEAEKGRPDRNGR